MYNADILYAAFRHQIGFFQPFDPSYTSLPAELITSDNGIYIQNVHPLLMHENIVNAVPEFELYDWKEWEHNKAYLAGNIVVYNQTLYKATTAVSGGGSAPTGAPQDAWQYYNPYADYLMQLYKAAGVELINDLLSVKRISQSSKQLIETVRLFDGLAPLTSRIIKTGRFVGFKIKVKSGEGLAVKLHKIGLQVDTMQNSFPIYVYASGNQNPIKQIDLNLNAAGNFSWGDIKDLLLNNNSDNNSTYYIGYFENYLIGQAVQRQYDWRGAPCAGCNEYNSYAHSTWSNHIEITPIATFANHPSSVDFSATTTHFDNNFGLNFALSVVCDLSDFFARHKAILITALSYKLALKLLGAIAFTTRINVISDKTRALAMTELSEKDPDSFFNKYKNELKALDFDFSLISRQCLPCTNTKGITYGTV
jgi:hypothetical protein